MEKELLEIAEHILESDPDPVVRYRLLKDILKLPRNDEIIIRAKKDIFGNKWVKQLQEEQWEDGSWGRFHSQDTELKQKISTTEFGVRYACQQGLDLDDLMLKKARDYCVSILNNNTIVRDRKEFLRFGSSVFDTGIKKIVAATLVEIEPNHPILKQYREFWVGILVCSYPGGKHNRESEIQAYSKSLNLTESNAKGVLRATKGKAFHLRDRYSIKLLGSSSELIPEEVEHAWVRHMWDEGIYYLSDANTEELSQKGNLISWFSVMEHLSLLPSWKKMAKSQMEWLLEQRDKEGMWEFENKLVMPISSNWKKKNYRKFDWTLKAMLILQKYLEKTI